MNSKCIAACYTGSLDNAGALVVRTIFGQIYPTIFLLKFLLQYIIIIIIITNIITAEVAYYNRG